MSLGLNSIPRLHQREGYYYGRRGKKTLLWAAGRCVLKQARKVVLEDTTAYTVAIERVTGGYRVRARRRRSNRVCVNAKLDDEAQGSMKDLRTIRENLTRSS